MKIKNKDQIKRMLLITLSNIGDIVLTLPVMAALKSEFPKARLDVLCGLGGKEIFRGHPMVRNLIVYDKFSGVKSKRRLLRELRKKRYDLVVDLRNSLFPILIGAKYRTSLIRKPPSSIRHKREAHLWKLSTIGLVAAPAQSSFHIDDRSKTLIDQLLADIKIKSNYVVVSPGARSHIKRWTRNGFAAVCDRLISELGADVIFMGDSQDKKIVQDIIASMKNRAVDLTAKLNLRQAGALIKRSGLLITNDSAPLHIGSALGARVLALFGPTDPAKYGPTGPSDEVIRERLECSPCEKAQCGHKHECMNLINPDEVFKAAKKMLVGP